MKFTKGNTTVNLEKLWFLQRAHAERAAKLYSADKNDKAGATVETMVDAIIKELPTLLKDHDAEQRRISRDVADRNLVKISDLRTYIRNIVVSDARNYTTPPAFLQRNRFFFVEPPDYLDSPDGSSANVAVESMSKLDRVRARFEKNPKDVQGTILQSVYALYNLQRITHLILLRLDGQWFRGKEAVWQDPRAIEYAMKTAVASLPETELANLENRYLGPELWTCFSDYSRSDLMPKLQSQMRKEQYGALCKYTRWVFLNGEDGPGVAATIAVLGRDTCLRRSNRATKYIDTLFKSYEDNSSDRSSLLST